MLTGSVFWRLDMVLLSNQRLCGKQNMIFDASAFIWFVPRFHCWLDFWCWFLVSGSWSIASVILMLNRIRANMFRPNRLAS